MSNDWFDFPDGSDLVWTRKGGQGTEVAERQLTRDQASVTKQVLLRRIPHNTSEPGITISFERKSRPKKDGTPRKDEEKDCSLYLNEIESQLLLDFLQEANVLRLKGIQEAFRKTKLEDIWGALLQRVSQSDRSALESVLRNGPVVPDIVGVVLEHHRREKEIARFRDLVEENALEKAFQAWFNSNQWVFQADAVNSLDDRRINVERIADLLFKSADGCVDLVELKRPKARFWRDRKEHKNWVPDTDLTDALTQVWNYQRDLERQVDSIQTRRRLQGAVVLRPHATLVHGRSKSWTDDQFEAQRLLNSSLHGVTVITYDQALARAERINEIAGATQPSAGSVSTDEYDPFADD